MYNSKRNVEPIEDEETSIWVCSDEECPCWMRENLSLEENPPCPLCASSMAKETKMLPPIVNNNFKFR
ncbi:cold-shock protein [Bacillus fonticola]|uniref:cold-shock protein n=1 Tax=Bacillus fonticola TaxID=2728853 RepID=UPI00147288CC|nr:cold-shock protein [Bacillus fonticola]